MSEQTTVSQRPAHKSPDESWPEYVERAVAKERERCAAVVQKAVDTYWSIDFDLGDLHAMVREIRNG